MIARRRGGTGSARARCGPCGTRSSRGAAAGPVQPSGSRRHGPVVRRHGPDRRHVQYRPQGQGCRGLRGSRRAAARSGGWIAGLAAVPTAGRRRRAKPVVCTDLPARDAWWPAISASRPPPARRTTRRYAFFPEARGSLSSATGASRVYDTGDHRISGLFAAAEHLLRHGLFQPDRSGHARRPEMVRDRVAKMDARRPNPDRRLFLRAGPLRGDRHAVPRNPLPLLRLPQGRRRADRGLVQRRARDFRFTAGRAQGLSGRARGVRVAFARTAARS